MDCEPLTDLEPDHAPEAVHAVALVADQVSVALLPLATVLGFAASAMVGTGSVTRRSLIERHSRHRCRRR